MRCWPGQHELGVLHCNTNTHSLSCLLQVRTSSGTFLARGEDEVVRRIEKRISLITMIPEGALGSRLRTAGRMLLLSQPA